MTVLQLINAEPNQDVIGILESALERAKSGEFIGVAYVAEMRDGGITTAIPGTAGFTNAFTMLGAIERLKMRFYHLHCEE